MKQNKTDFEIGRINHLILTRFAKQGAYLSLPSLDVSRDSMQPSKEVSEILLPNKFIPSGAALNSALEVFVYTDSEDRLVATTQKPLAMRDEVAVLNVVDVSENGCFLDIGLDKHIFMPSKRASRFQIHDRVCVFITLDKQNRLIAKLGVKEHLKPAKNIKNLYATRKALVFECTPLGFGCVVEGRYYGLLYHTHVVSEVKLMDWIWVQIDRIRGDGKMDLRCDFTHQKDKLRETLKRDGVLELNYDSHPDEIAKAFGMSKKQFKKTLSEMIANQKALIKDGKIFWR